MILSYLEAQDIGSDCYPAFRMQRPRIVCPRKMIRENRRRWLVTLEEFTNVRDSAVAILINQLMDGYQEITLPTGKVIHRHPNTVVVFACNTDESQTGELQASTLSRLTTKYYIDFPTKPEMIRRIRNITGFDDAAVLEQMASVVVTLRKYIDEHGFNGVCGVREFA